LLFPLQAMAFNSQTSKTVRIVVADDHAIFRDGLVKLLETKADLRVVGTAGDGQAAMKVVGDLDPDLLLLDVAMPRMTGLAALSELRLRATRASVILVTAAIDRSEIITGLELGAHGVVLKDS